MEVGYDHSKSFKKKAQSKRSSQIMVPSSKQEDFSFKFFRTVKDNDRRRTSVFEPKITSKL